MPYQHSPKLDDPAGTSERFGPLPRTMLAFAERAAQSRAPVLLYGETGSGKTLLARLIHELSPRAARPFKRINCGGVPESLFERELFGHVRGAFTDAKEAQPGFFEAAHGGTLFLDEIGELPLTVQPKLLAALEEGYIRRIGCTREIAVDVRVLTATNRDLQEMIRTKAFRQDLYYRLGFVKYKVPPLRERQEQIPEIAQHVLQRLVERGLIPPGPIPEINPDALEILRTYSWPGNLRELEHVLTYAVTFFRTPVIVPEHLHEDLLIRSRADAMTGGSARARRERYVAPPCPEEEKQLILEALRAEGGNRTRAARRLGMTRSTFYTKLALYNLLSSASSPEPGDGTLDQGPNDNDQGAARSPVAVR